MRHMRIAQHEPIWREKIQISKAFVHSTHAKTSTFGAHSSLSSSSRRKRVSPTATSLPPSSRKS